MIRIKNIAQENRNLMSSVEKLNLPKGGFIRVRTRHEVVIDYQTYMLNKSRIILPGDSVRGKVAFRVVDGVQEIDSKSGRGTTQAPPTAIVDPPPNESPMTAEDHINNQNESPGQEVINPPGEDISPNDDTNVNPIEAIPTGEGAEDAQSDIGDDLSTEGSDVQATPDTDAGETEPGDGAEPHNPSSEGKGASVYERSGLEPLSHRELDELLAKHGIEVPQRSNKTVKIEALLRLNG